MNTKVVEKDPIKLFIFHKEPSIWLPSASNSLQRGKKCHFWPTHAWFLVNIQQLESNIHHDFNRDHT